MKKTIFNELHIEKNAKMVEFAGFEMPIQYPKGIISEHKVVRNNVGVFDVSHMGEFEIDGKDALAYVQKITTNDASKLTAGKVQYSAFCLPSGGIVDDLLVYRKGENSFMLVVNGANIDKDFAWCEKNLPGFDVVLKNVSDEFNLLAIQGPKSIDTLQKLTKTNLFDIVYYSFELGKLAGVDMILSRTGYTGEIGFELYFRGDFNTAKKVWDEVFKAGEEFGIEPVGLGCRDTLRLEKGYCLYGNDIDETTNPLEAGLGWITKINKGDFNGKDVIQKVKDEGLKRKLVAFTSEDKKFIPRHHYKIFSDNKEIGHVTSGNLSPTLDKPIGMGYVATEFATPGSEIQIEARGKHFPAVVVKLPFVQ
ncbi:MAG TPA: glycine cleavage system aminomethyltransferase GcvT [Candidatus Kapabacteria bacterium]|nr:glycine cleavage system aminomethyltransferase GcvT [Candidatus Kapabacteria bacterium]